MSHAIDAVNTALFMVGGFLAIAGVLLVAGAITGLIGGDK